MWEPALTPMERRVLEALGRTGGTNRELGAALGIAEKTVKIHMANVCLKLGVSNRTQVALWWCEHRRAV